MNVDNRKVSSTLAISWTNKPGRSVEIAQMLECKLLLFSGVNNLNFLRKLKGYIRNSILTSLYIMKNRSEIDLYFLAIPPWPLFWITLIFSRGKAHIVLDAHPGAFGDLGDELSGKLFRVTKKILCRVDFCIVANKKNQHELSKYGVPAMIFGEVFPKVLIDTEIKRENFYLLPWTFSQDDPVQKMIGHIQRCDSCPPYLITGEVPLIHRETMNELVSSGKVIEIGYVAQDTLRHYMSKSLCTIALTTDPNSRMRVAIEAVWFGSRVVTSDSETMREALPMVDFVDSELKNLHDALQTTKKKTPQQLMIDRQLLLDIQSKQVDELVQNLSKFLRN